MICLYKAPLVCRNSHLKDLDLADPTFYQPGRIDLLIGGDILSQVMLPDSRAGPKDTPTAWKTIFGWAILGPFQPTNRHQPTAVSSFIHSTVAEPIDQVLSQFWEIEEVSSLTAAFTPEEEKVQHHFMTTYLYLPSIK